MIRYRVIKPNPDRVPIGAIGFIPPEAVYDHAVIVLEFLGGANSRSVFAWCQLEPVSQNVDLTEGNRSLNRTQYITVFCRSCRKKMKYESNSYTGQRICASCKSTEKHGKIVAAKLGRQAEQLLVDYKLGYTQKELSLKYALSTDRLRQFLLSHNIALRNSYETQVLRNKNGLTAQRRKENETCTN